MAVFSEQYDEMKSIVEAVFTRMPGSVCKRDALLKWCVERLATYVSRGLSLDARIHLWDLGNIDDEFLQFLDGWHCLLLVVALVLAGSY